MNSLVMVPIALLLCVLLSNPCWTLENYIGTENPRILGFQRYFNAMDKNRDGEIDRNEMVTWDQRYAKAKVHHPPPKQERVDYAMGRIDKDGSGGLDFDEFLALRSNARNMRSPLNSYRRGQYSSDVAEIHLSFTDDYSAAWVMWITQSDVIPPTTTVQYGTQSGEYTFTATGTNHTYDAGIFGWYGWIHQVQLTNLLPLTKYYYRCGDATTGWSDEYSFITMRDAPSSGNPTSIYAVYGDQGTYIPMGWAVTDQLVDDNAVDPIDMIVHLGDICYAGTGSTDELEEIWDVWEDQVQPLAAYMPYMFAVGNHEHYYNWAAYTNRFIMPGAQSGGNGNFWWSMDHHYVHWTQMSTEHPYTVGSPQYKWLEQDLAAASSPARRSQVPFIIVTGHRPMYCSDEDEWDQHHPGAPLQTIIEPLFKKYQVDLYLSGHMHMYERILPVYNGTVVQTGNVYRNPGATAQMVQGTGGVFTDWDYVDPQPAWSAVRNDFWGYGKITVFNTTTMHYEFLHEDDDAVVDDFWLIKS